MLVKPAPIGCPSPIKCLSLSLSLTLLQKFQPMTTQISKKSALPLARILATASCHSSNTQGPELDTAVTTASYMWCDALWQVSLSLAGHGQRCAVTAVTCETGGTEHVVTEFLPCVFSLIMVCHILLLPSSSKSLSRRIQVSDPVDEITNKENSVWQIEAGTKWPPFHRRHF